VVRVDPDAYTRPCPRCGGSADRLYVNASTDGGTQRTAYCPACRRGYAAGAHLPRPPRPRRYPRRLLKVTDLHQPITYRGMHTRVRSYRGSPTTYRCVDCGGQAEEWSYSGRGKHELTEIGTGPKGTPITVTYSTDCADYEPRCVSCHRRHDSAFFPRPSVAAVPPAPSIPPGTPTLEN
jgi:NAD-dependent SIR2 family protein deacetylase